MELLSISKARSIAQFPTDELNPHGRALIPDVVAALIERYGFIKFPQKPEEFDEDKGVSFELGRWNDLSIDQLLVFTDGLIVDTRSSTGDSSAIIADVLTWAADSFGLTFRPDMLSRQIYFSEVTFRSECQLSTLNPALSKVAEMLSASVARITGQVLPYDVAQFNFNFDPLESKLIISPFRVERLGNTPYSENKYYSTAPMPTEEHLELLAVFESALKP